MNCPNCQKPIDAKKITFRMSCEFCDIDLHTCKNCRFYYPGKPNDCTVPNTFVKDKESANFCEDYFFKEHKKEKPRPNQEALKKAFGDIDISNSKKDFDSLFSSNQED